MKINILYSLLLLSFVVFVTSQDDKTDDKDIEEVKNFIMKLKESAAFDDEVKKSLEKLLPLNDDVRKAAMELIENVKKSAMEDAEKAKPPTPDGKPGSKPDDKPGSKPDDKPGSKPDDKPGSKPDDKPGSKPDDKPGSKPGDKPDKKPGDKPDKKPDDKPVGEKDVVKTFVMIVKDIKTTTKKTFTSIKDLIKNGLKGRPRQPLIKKLVDRLSDKDDLPADKPIYILLDPSNGLSVSSNPEEIADLLKKFKKKESEKKKGEADEDDADDDDGDDALEEILSFLDIDV